MNSVDYPRDMVGYGEIPPHPQWPDEARIAVSFVINYEEGGESCVLHGDDCSETLLAQAIGEAPVMAGRDVEAETIFEYGSRAGFWPFRTVSQVGWDVSRRTSTCSGRPARRGARCCRCGRCWGSD